MFSHASKAFIIWPVTSIFQGFCLFHRFLNYSSFFCGSKFEFRSLWKKNFTWVGKESRNFFGSGPPEIAVARLIASFLIFFLLFFFFFLFFCSKLSNFYFLLLFLLLCTRFFLLQRNPFCRKCVISSFKIATQTYREKPIIKDTFRNKLKHCYAQPL